MSAGINPYDFVQQVYYLQEKVILDFFPTDDKYKEVLMEANHVLQELQKEEDWLWLREEVPIGFTGCPTPDKSDLSFVWDTEKYYKPSTLYGDCVRLHHGSPVFKYTDSTGTIAEAKYVAGKDWTNPIRNIETWADKSDIEGYDTKTLDNFEWCKHKMLRVPFVSAGYMHNIPHSQMGFGYNYDVENVSLGAISTNNVIRFNRPLVPREFNKVVLVDMQRRLQPFHICHPHCQGVKPDKEISYYPGVDYNPCSELVAYELDEDGNLQPVLEGAMYKWKTLYQEIPDINWLVTRTAALRADSSPMAQARAAGLQDQALKLMSAMRENNAAATTPDWVERQDPFVFEVY